MKNKINILIITAIATIIVFIISTKLQKDLIDYVPSVKCLTLSRDIKQFQKLEEDMFVLVDIPIPLIASTRVIQNFSEIEGLYSKDNIFKNQIAIREQFDTKENLSIYETEIGKEKISIKIEAAENGMSYAVKSGAAVNLYATMRNDLAIKFLPSNQRMIIGDEYDGYIVIKILDNVKVLGAFNSDGIEINVPSDGIVDTIMLGVTSEEAKQISLIRNVASFNITGIGTNDGGSIDEEV